MSRTKVRPGTSFVAKTISRCFIKLLRLCNLLHHNYCWPYLCAGPLKLNLYVIHRPKRPRPDCHGILLVSLGGLYARNLFFCKPSLGTSERSVPKYLVVAGVAYALPVGANPVVYSDAGAGILKLITWIIPDTSMPRTAISVIRNRFRGEV